MLFKYFHFVEIDKTSKQKKEIRDLTKEHKKDLEKSVRNKPDWTKSDIEKLSKQSLSFFYYNHSFIKEDEIDSIELMDPPRLSFYTKEDRYEDFEIFDKNSDHDYLPNFYEKLLFNTDNSTDKTFFGKDRKNKYLDDIPSNEYQSHKEEQVTVYQITKKNGEIIKWVRSIETILDQSLTMKIDDLNLLLSRLEKIDSNDRLDNISDKLEDIKEFLEKLIPESSDEEEN